MHVRWLGWAGVEIEAEGERVVVDPLADAAAVFAPFGEAARSVPVPDVRPSSPGALAGLVTHLHRDHADAAALAGALASGASVFEPADDAGRRDGNSRLAIAQANAELDAAGVTRRRLPAWSTETVGPFTLTALPAVDGTGDPQVSWLVEAGGRRVLHLGDTCFHGWWWRFAEHYGAPDVVLAPINGARVAFAHRRPASPLPAVMDPEQAALAAELLGATRLVPIHFGAYAFPGVYEPVPDALERVREYSDHVCALEPGEAIEL